MADFANLNPRQQLDAVVAELAAARADHDRLHSELGAINRSAGNQDLSAGQTKRWNDTTVALEKVNARMTVLANQRDALMADRTERARSLTGAGITTETGDGAAGVARYGGNVNVNRNADPADTLERANHAGGLNTHEGAALLRDAARAAIDAWSSRSDVPADYQESAERAVAGGDRYSREVAEYVAACSTPAYEQAWRQWMVGGAASLMGEDALEMRRVAQFLSQRAMNEGSVGAGGAAVPPMLDPALVMTNAGKADSWRTVSKIKTIATQTWRGVTTQGVVSHWTAEASELTDDSPSLAQPTITPVRMTSYIQASFEMVEDTSLAQDIAMLFQDGRDRLEATAFATGTGATQPWGLCSQLDNTTASRLNCTTSGVVGLVDLYAADSALPPRFRGNASWMANKAYLNKIRQAVLPAATNFSAWVDFAGDMPSKMLGYPVYEASGMSTATASNTDVVVLGDFSSGYFIIDRTPSMVANVPMILGANRRPTGEQGWALFTRVGADCVVPQAFQMIRL